MQTYRMGNKQEMVVAVRAPEGKQGPIAVTLTTDVPQDIFLHWGVRAHGRGDWVAPPKVPSLPSMCRLSPRKPLCHRAVDLGLRNNMTAVSAHYQPGEPWH